MMKMSILQHFSNHTCLQKLKTEFWTFGFASLLASKLVLRFQTPKARFWEIGNAFHVEVDKILHKIGLYF